MRKFAVRLSTLATIIFAILSCGSLFWVSQQVQQLEREQRQLNQEIASQKEGIRVLDAEWDYLNRPDRLEVLVSQHLKTMVPVEPENLLRDAKAVPEPKFIDDETERTILVADEPQEKLTAKKQSAKPLAVPDSRPIRAPDKAEKNFDSILDNLSAGDE